MSFVLQLKTMTEPNKFADGLQLPAISAVEALEKVPKHIPG